MKRTADVFALAALFAFVIALAMGGPACSCGGGDDDDDEPVVTEDPAPAGAEAILEEMTGYPWSLSAGDVGVTAGPDWRFLFAIKLTGAQSALLDEAWEVDFRSVRDELARVGKTLAGEGLDLSGVSGDPVAIAHIEPQAAGARLVFANKLSLSNLVMTVDERTADLLAGGVGGKGPGWYAAFAPRAPQAFVTGFADPCPGAGDALAIVRGSPFVAKPDLSGAFALPVTRANRPAAIFISAGECFGFSSVAATDAIENPNPKCASDLAPAPCDTPDTPRFADGTPVAGPVAIDMFATPGDPVDEGCVDCDFESGAPGWSFAEVGGGPPDPCFGTSGEGHGALFPDSAGDNYAYLTTGGDGRTACLAWRKILVPAGATTIAIRYDLVTQEWPAFAGTAYTDLFAAAIVGRESFVIARAIDNEATGGDFVGVPPEASAIAGIGASADAAGPAFAGHLAWAPGDASPRGGAATSHRGVEARAPVIPGETITLVFGVLDTTDDMFDTAAVIDSVSVE
ncbi:hypothetical protein K8I61_13425 [bacterium]|nr:hypothetical protein [bacterium]